MSTSAADSIGDEVRPLASQVRHFCPVCLTVFAGEFGPGPGGRPQASCPECGSLERHRYLACLLDMLRSEIGPAPTMLEVAPSPQTAALLQRLHPSRIVSLDFDPSVDGRRVDVQASLTSLPFIAGKIDLLLCFHVLEHIPNDRAAMREISRVLADNGVAVVQVPWRAHRQTDEDPEASPQERLRRFGRVDHVRYYGRDFEARLLEAGLSVERSQADALLGTALCEWMGLRTDDAIWVLRRARPGGAALSITEGIALPTAVDALSAQVREVTQALPKPAAALDHEVLARRQARRIRQLRRRIGALSSELQRQRTTVHLELRLPAAVARRVRRHLL